MSRLLDLLPGGHSLFSRQQAGEIHLGSKLLDFAYVGQTFFSRLQGIEYDNPRRNGEYRLIRRLRKVLNFVVDAGANLGNWSARVRTEAPISSKLVQIL